MVPTDGQQIATGLTSPCPARAEHGTFYGTQGRQQLTTYTTEPSSQLSVRWVELTRFKVQTSAGWLRKARAVHNNDATLSFRFVSSASVAIVNVNSAASDVRSDETKRWNRLEFYSTVRPPASDQSDNSIRWHNDVITKKFWGRRRFR